MAEITEKIRGFSAEDVGYALRRVDPRALDRPDQPFVLVDLTTIVGRDPRAAGLCVDDPSVSRQHFVVRFLPRRRIFEVADLGSSNGLTVNAERVHACELAPNDVVRAGGQLFVFVEVRAGALQPEALERAFFEGCSPTIRQANRLLHDLPVGSRALLVGPAGVGKGAAVGRLARQQGLGERVLHVHGTSLRDGRWEEGFRSRLAEATPLRPWLVHFEEPWLAPRQALQRLEFLLQGPPFTPSGAVTVVATTQGAPGSPADDGRGPGLLPSFAPPIVRIPPLCARREDIVPQVVAALVEQGRRARVAGTAGFVEALLLHPWPGNAREVGALVELLAAAGRLDAELDEADLSGRLLEAPGGTPGAKDRLRVLQALKASRGNVSVAARTLGCSRRHFYRLAERHGIEPSAWRPGSSSRPLPT